MDTHKYAVVSIVTWPFLVVSLSPGEGVAGNHVPEDVEHREGEGEAGHLHSARPLLLQVLTFRKVFDIPVFKQFWNVL